MTFESVLNYYTCLLMANATGEESQSFVCLGDTHHKINEASKCLLYSSFILCPRHEMFSSKSNHPIKLNLQPN